MLNMDNISLFKRLAVAAKMQRSEVKISKSGLYGRSNLSPKQAYEAVTAILNKYGLPPQVATRKIVAGVEVIVGSCYNSISPDDERIVYFVFTESTAGTLVSVAGLASNW